MKNYEFDETAEKTTYTVDELFQKPGVYARQSVRPYCVDYIVLQPGVGFYVFANGMLSDPQAEREHHRADETKFERLSAPSITFNF